VAALNDVRAKSREQNSNRVAGHATSIAVVVVVVVASASAPWLSFVPPLNAQQDKRNNEYP
jgi:hypothetical protein